jgi:hypothetical protein
MLQDISLQLMAAYLVKTLFVFKEHEGSLPTSLSFDCPQLI